MPWCSSRVSESLVEFQSNSSNQLYTHTYIYPHTFESISVFTSSYSPLHSHKECVVWFYYDCLVFGSEGLEHDNRCEYETFDPSRFCFRGKCALNGHLATWRYALERGKCSWGRSDGVGFFQGHSREGGSEGLFPRYASAVPPCWSHRDGATTGLWHCEEACWNRCDWLDMMRLRDAENAEQFSISPLRVRTCNLTRQNR